MNGKTVLVTGGAGFLGSHFVRRALAGGAALVVNFDKLSYAGDARRLDDVAADPRYRFVHADITDAHAVRHTLQGADGLINFAAESHVDRSIQDCGPFVRTNVLGTQVLLDAARHARLGRFLQVSTDEVYGSLGPTGAFTEDTPLAPNSPWSKSAMCIEPPLPLQ